MNHFNKNITFLNFDHTIENQQLLLEYMHEQIDFLDLVGTQGYCSKQTAEIIKKRISKRHKDNPVFIGNGNYHYVSYLLLSEIQKPFNLVLFDHHTDAMPYDDELMSCGSWVSFALDTLPNLKKVVIIGATNEYPIPYEHKNRVLLVSEENLINSGVKTIRKQVEYFLDSSDIYISVDKDVLYENDAYTNWDQGSMSLLQLLYLLRSLNETYSIYGLDVCGEYPLNPTEMLIFNPKIIHTNEIANRAIMDILQIKEKVSS